MGINRKAMYSLCEIYHHTILPELSLREADLAEEHLGTLLKEISRALQECDAPSILAGDAHLLPARQARTSAFAGGLQQGPSKT